MIQKEELKIGDVKSFLYITRQIGELQFCSHHLILLLSIWLGIRRVLLVKVGDCGVYVVLGTHMGSASSLRRFHFFTI